MKLAGMACGVAAATGILVAAPVIASAQARPSGTPAELVTAYDALADVILAAHKAERKLVLSVLAAAYGHAQSEMARARQALKAGDAAGAKSATENLATTVGQMGTEGDNAIGGVRKRLLEGGHFANANAVKQGTHDEGYVIVSKAAKQAFLDSSKAIAQLARDPKAEALEAEWKKVEAAWAKSIAPAK